MAKERIKDFLERVSKDFFGEEGYELYNVEFVKEGKDWFLRVYIDKLDATPISMDDCEKVSRFLSEILDKEDPITQNYYLEVSSPGIDRELFTLEHYKRFIGQMVEVKLYEPIENSKRIEGELLEANDEFIELLYENKKVKEKINIKMSQVAKCKLSIIF